VNTDPGAAWVDSTGGITPPAFRNHRHATVLALKVLYLAVRNLEEFRRPNVGIRSSGWKQALQAFTIYFDGRIPTP
jgi:hypothetical protein